MPKIVKYPRLRSHVRKGKSGQVHVYWYYDMRPDGKPDVPLGSDHAEALRKWDELHNRKPRVIGRLQEAFDRWRDAELKTYERPDTRRSYAKQLRTLEPVLGGMTWDDVTLPILREYLDRRSAKTQGNREMSLLSVIWGKARIWGMTKLPWPAAGVKNWKNAERARQFEVTDDLFTAVYAVADQVLQDAMDIATATGMRVTDVRTILMPTGDALRLGASKTSKSADFDLTHSPLLAGIVERRKGYKANHLMLLSTPTGRPVSQGMLRDRWDEARNTAAASAEQAGEKELAKQIRAMYLRDMRKRAADLTESDMDAASLLQHSSVAVTRKHYRTKATQLKPVR